MKAKHILRRLSVIAVGGSIFAMPSICGAQVDESQPDYQDDQTGSESWPEAQQTDPMGVGSMDAQEKHAKMRLDPNQEKFSDIQGASVQGTMGEKVGKVKDLIINTSSNQAEFALVGKDDFFDTSKAIVPVDQLSKEATQAEGLRSESDELAYKLNLNEEQFDKLADIEFDEDDISGSLTKSMHTINELFSANLDESSFQDASYRLASDLSDLKPADSSSDVSKVEELALDWEGDKKLSFILSDKSGQYYEVPSDELNITAEDRITIRNAKSLSEFELVSTGDASATGYASSSEGDESTSGQYSSSAEQQRGTAREAEDAYAAEGGSDEGSEDYTSAKYQWNEMSDLGAIADPNAIVGTKVQDRDGQSVGKVSDVLVGQTNGEIAYLVVQNDNWFNRSAAIIPAQSASAARKEAPQMSDPSEQAGQKEGESEKFDAIVLRNMTEDEFEENSDFEGEPEEAAQYISENRAALASKHGVSEQDLPTNIVALSSTER